MSNDKCGELLGQERRRRWSTDQKLAIVRGSLEPGQSVSVVARRNGINANKPLLWRKLYQDGSLSAVSAGEAVVPASRLTDALKQIRELQRMLGKKTMEAEVPKEGEYHQIDYATAGLPTSESRQSAFAQDYGVVSTGRRNSVVKTLGGS
ncbi:transposase, partial [Pseudomonas sp. BAV 4579]